MPTTASTGTAQVGTDTAAYDRAFRYALRAPLTFVRAADVGVVNGTHKGSSFVFNFRNDLAIATTPLTELADVSPVAGSDTTASVTINEYGNVEVVSAKLRGTAYISETVRTANTMGYNGGLTFDTLARDPLLAGTNVLYPDNYNAALTGTSRVTIVAADVFQAAAARLVYANLSDANVVPFDDGNYRAWIANKVALDLRTETGAASWREPHVNAGDPNAVDPIWNNSIGEFEGFTWIATPRLAAAQLPSGFVNGGAGATVDVYPTVFAGREALGKVWADIDDGENGPMPIFGESPITDNLKRFRGYYWYWQGGFGRIREAALWRVESAASTGAN
jgi:N4-gp56 family major capsid protein